MYQSAEPQRPPWPRVLSDGIWAEITPSWILGHLQHGLTPRSADAIALAAHQIGLSVEQLHRIALAFVAIESEVTL
jgi:hypothetical protein